MDRLVSIKELFNDCYFRIPDYQRGYSWTDKERKEFWEDLENIPGDGVHYTGMITVCEIKVPAPEDKWLGRGYQIVDGQQRLTTIIILINECLKYARQQGYSYLAEKMLDDWTQRVLYRVRPSSSFLKSYMFGYEEDDPSYEFFKAKVLEQSSTGMALAQEMTLYTKNLMAAKQFFAQKIADHDFDKLNVLFEKITERLKFNYFPISEELDVYVTFETMNNRGLGLSKLELLKNRLIFLSTLLPVEEQDQERARKCINDAWKTIYSYLGKESIKALRDDDFLKDHWIMYFHYDRSKSETYASDLLNEYFTTKSVSSGKIDMNYILTYVHSLDESVIHWYKIQNPARSDYSVSEKKFLERLDMQGIGAFRPLLMAAFQKKGEDRTELLKACDRFRFLVFGLADKRRNTCDSDFYRAAHSLFAGSISIKNIIDDIRSKADFYFQDNLFLTNIQEKFRSAEGFYSWTDRNYFVYQYEVYLQAAQAPKTTWCAFIAKINETLEHIYPQKAKDKYWTIRFGADEDNSMLNSLGNFLLLSRSKNAKQQNFDFPTKVKHKDGNGEDIGYFNGSYSEIEVAQVQEWNRASIKRRGLKMLQFMEKEWDIVLSGDVKKGLLFIDDVDGIDVSAQVDRI